MKNYNVTGLIFILFFLVLGVTYAQSPAEESYNKGVGYAVQGEFMKAQEEFEKALKVDSFYGPAERSLKIIKDVIEQEIKRETAIHLFKGASYHNKSQYDQAISEYTKTLEINPKYVDAYNNRGIAYVDKGKYDQAFIDYNKAIEINPKYALAYYNRGIAYANKEKYDQAIKDFNKALEINSKYALAYNNRGFAYANKGKYDQAIKDFNKALEINPKNTEAYYNRGIAYDKKGKYDQAIKDFSKVLEINPKFAMAHSNRGFTYFVNLGNKVKGCDDWKKACELGECKNYNLAKQQGDCQ
jgi:tetratricopeptide (TPR) repeat protein